MVVVAGGAPPTPPAGRAEHLGENDVCVREQAVADQKKSESALTLHQSADDCPFWPVEISLPRGVRAGTCQPGFAALKEPPEWNVTPDRTGPRSLACRAFAL